MKRYVEVKHEVGDFEMSQIFIDDEMIESFECNKLDDTSFLGSHHKSCYQGKLNLVSGKTIFLMKRDNYDDAFKEILYVIEYWDKRG